MPLHIELNAPILVLPFDPTMGDEAASDEMRQGKEILIPVADAGTTYHYKMTPELAAEIIKQLGMDSEELMKHHRMQAMSQSLQLPQGLDISKIMENGGQG